MDLRPTAVNATGLSVSGLADGLYEAEADLIFTSAATTTGFKPGLVWPATVTCRGVTEVANSAAALVVSNFNSSGTYAPGTAVAVANSSYFARISFTFRVDGAMASALAVSFKSEVAASAVTVKADSFLKYRKIA